jgi:signal transduction histidine kinase
VLTRALAEITHTLESTDEGEQRLQWALMLLARVVPYRRCALLQALPQHPHTLWVTPDPEPQARGPLLAELEELLELMGDRPGQAQRMAQAPDLRPHLAIPLVGLDQVVGVLRVEASEGTVYDADHLRLLSVVAAALSAYLVNGWLRERAERQMKELAAAHDFQQRLAGIVSHDLRNPLTVITVAGSALLRKQRPEQERKTLGRILTSASKAERIVHDLLDVTRARVTGGLWIHRTRVDLRQLVEDLLEEARLSHPDRALAFDVHGDGAVVGDWDPERLWQALTNLLNNALQLGDKAAAVRLGLETGAEQVELSVHNRGAPIPPASLPGLFDPFTQGSGPDTRPAGGGLGLGLYIVAQIARAHRGEIQARSSAAEGTTFTLRLPRFEVGAQADPGPAPGP